MSTNAVLCPDCNEPVTTGGWIDPRNRAHHIGCGDPLGTKATAARIADLEASMRHAVKIEAELRGIIRHWDEFGEMMGVRDDYGLSERMDAARKLIG